MNQEVNRRQKWKGREKSANPIFLPILSFCHPSAGLRTVERSQTQSNEGKWRARWNPPGKFPLMFAYFRKFPHFTDFKGRRMGFGTTRAALGNLRYQRPIPSKTARNSSQTMLSGSICRGIYTNRL